MTGRDDNAGLPLRHALALAGRGWRVFPCDPETKRPLVQRASSPGAKDGGLWLGTDDETKIRAWWRTRPRAMIGVRAGADSGFWVLDFDPNEAVARPKIDPETGEECSFEGLLAGLEQQLGRPLPATLTSLTPRGGRHMLFRWNGDIGPEGHGITNSRGGISSRMIDVRGEGGYIIVPPSVRAGPKAAEEGCEGAAYRWLDADAEIAEAPPELVDLVLRRGRFARAAAAPARSVEPAHRGGGVATGDAEADAVRRYGLGALDRAVQDIATAAAGTRNQTINDRCLSIGHLVGAGALSESLARAALEDAAAALGLPSGDKAFGERGTIARALRDGMSSPADLSHVRASARERAERKKRRSPAQQPEDDAPFPGGAEDYGRAEAQAEAVPPEPRLEGPSPAAVSPAPTSRSKRRGSRAGGSSADPSSGGGEGVRALYQRLGGLPRTDLGNAKRFLARFGGLFCFVREWGWLAWDGKRWSKTGAEGRLEGHLKLAIEMIADEADAVRGTDADIVVEVRKRGDDVTLADALDDWALTSQGAGHISCLKPLVQSDLERQIAEFDSDPMRINVLNGTLVVRAHATEPYIKLRPHNPADMITKICPVIYDPEAVCPRFDIFMDEVQPDKDAEGRKPVQRLLDQWGGYCLTGDASEQKLLFFHGRGRNGKSVWVDTVGWLAGDYGATIPIESFLDQGRGRSGGAATPDLAILPGVRMLRTSEPEKNAKLAESLIKLVTGGEPLTARHLNKEFFSFVVQFKLTIQGNYRPRVDGHDEGIWGRLVLVPWGVFIPKHRRDKKLTEKLRAEASGILNRLLAGLCDWLDNGLVIPEIVEQATDAFREDSDPLGRFMATCTRHAISKRVQASEMHKVFCAWAKCTGETEWSSKGLANALKERGVPSRKSSQSWWLDIELTKSVNDFVDYNGNPLSVDDDDGEAFPSTPYPPD